MPFSYHQPILDELARHGLNPLRSTPPARLRDAVRDLYKYEIKRLRSRLLEGGIPRLDYANQVVILRKRYPLLSVPTELWAAEDTGNTGNTEHTEDTEDTEGSG